MGKVRNWQMIARSDTGILILLALLRFVPLLLHNGQAGWHRDELDFLDNARHLAWGYVSYPPLTPFLGRVALTLFGPSLVGVRLFSALAGRWRWFSPVGWPASSGAGAGHRCWPRLRR